MLNLLHKCRNLLHKCWNLLHNAEIYYTDAEIYYTKGVVVAPHSVDEEADEGLQSRRSEPPRQHCHLHPSNKIYYTNAKFTTQMLKFTTQMRRFTTQMLNLLHKCWNLLHKRCCGSPPRRRRSSAQMPLATRTRTAAAARPPSSIICFSIICFWRNEISIICFWLNEIYYTNARLLLVWPNRVVFLVAQKQSINTFVEGRPPAHPRPSSSSLLLSA